MGSISDIFGGIGVVKRDSKGVCALWSVAGLAITEKRKARADKTKGSNGM